MSKYIDPQCEQCDEYSERYGCLNSECPIRIDYEEGMAEMAADFEHDKRKEDNMSVGKEIIQGLNEAVEWAEGK